MNWDKWDQITFPKCLWTVIVCVVISEHHLHFVSAGDSFLLRGFLVSSKWWFCSCFESFMLNARDLSDIFQPHCASNSLTRPFLILIFFLHPHNLFPFLKSLWKFWQSLIHYFAQFSCLNTLHRLCLISIHFATYPLLPNWKTTCVITPSKLFGVPTM